MKKFGILFAIYLILCASSAWAANSVTLGTGGLAIVLDSADFVWSTATVTAGDFNGKKLTDMFPDGLALVGVKFYPSAANDVLVVRNKSLTGYPISKMKSADGITPLKDWIVSGKFYKPYMEWDDQTEGTPANCIIWLEFTNQPR